MNVEVIEKNLAGFTGTAYLVKAEKAVVVKDWNDEETCQTQYFVVSGTYAMFSGWEVLVFPADKDGNVLDWSEVAGNRGVTHDDAISELTDWLDEQEVVE